MADTTNGAPANYDDGQTMYMYPTAVYEATFYRKSVDVIMHIGGDAAHGGVNISLNGQYDTPWTGDDPNGSHVGMPGLVDITTANVFPSSIHVSGTEGDYSYGAVPALVRDVSDSFQRIYDIWKNLSLSWIGDAADAAQELQDKLDNIQKRLFGDKVDGKDVPGVIEQMSSAAAGAARLYSNVEETNTKMFNDFADDIKWTPLPDENASDSGGSTDAPDTKDLTYGPVTEKFS